MLRRQKSLKRLDEEDEFSLPHASSTSLRSPAINLAAPEGRPRAATVKFDKAAMAANAAKMNAQSSHMLKTGRRGNPFCKVCSSFPTKAKARSHSEQDTHDLFATLMVSLTLGSNTRFFRTYHNSFTTDDAASNLANLRFSQSNRAADPNDPSRIVTTTTTTTFSMSRDIAKGICQHFMDARLIENAVDPAAVAFRERGIFHITPKGLHILERFITKNGISADHIVRVFASQNILVHLITLERRLADDDLDLSRRMLEYVWRRFSGGKHPNYIVSPNEASRAVQQSRAQPFVDQARAPAGFERSRGVELQDVTERASSSRSNFQLVRHVLNAGSAVEWLIDFTTCVCRDEAAELVSHFVRMGWITLYMDRSKPGDKLIVIEAKTDARQVASGDPVAEFRWGPRITYRISDEGRRLAGSDSVAVTAAASTPSLAKPAERQQSASQEASLEDDTSSNKSGQTKPSGGVRGPEQQPRTGPQALTDALDMQLMSRKLVDLFRGEMSEGNSWAKEQHSSTTRLKAILDEPALRALFREYLRSNYCEENLGFWLDVADFRRRFSTTSSAVGGARSFSSSGRREPNATNAMEIHQQHLVNAAMQIYHTYLAPLSANELNIDHNLRADVVNFITKASLDNASSTPAGEKLNPLNAKTSIGSTAKSSTSAEGGATSTASPDPDAEPVQPPIALRATQVQALLRHYERIQDHIFRLLATDQVRSSSLSLTASLFAAQVPKFIRTPRFLELLELHVRALSSTVSTYAHNLTQKEDENEAETGKAS